MRLATDLIESKGLKPNAPMLLLSRAEPNPKVYKPPMPYPQLLSRPRVSTRDSDDTLLEAFR